ncbi:MAG: ECF transporter S component [Candidatus Scatomorpha sp.]|jgi:riboflavin transporter FmnP
MDTAKKTPSYRKVDVKKLVTLAMITCIAYIVMLLSKLMPSVYGFLDFDFKDVIICIGGFIYGPVAAGTVALVVAFIEMITISTTGPWGFLMNFLATASFCCTACYVYKKHHTMKGAVLGLSLGVVLLVVVMLLWNYFITPIYQGMPRQAIVELLLPVFLPFNAVKGGMNLAATLLLYKPVVTALRRAKLIPESDHAAPPVAGKKRLGVTLVSLFVLVTFVLLALVLADKI